MRKNIICVVLALMMLASFACAETAAPSITIAQLVAPVGVTYAEDLKVALTVVEPETAPAVVLEEISTFVETDVVANYFGEETMTAAAEFLPEELDVATLKLDELMPLTLEGYDAEYGDIEAAFQFVTPYEDGTVLLAMVGILPAEDAAEDAEIVWLPAAAEVVEGQVKITFTQEVMETLSDVDTEVVLALLRAEDAEAAE